MIKVIFLGLLSVVLFNSCAKKSDDIVTKIQTHENCILENTLLAKGIIGGKRVLQTDSDSAAVAMIYSQFEKDSAICTATLIGPKVLLTAAHCIKASANKTLVIFYSAISCESGFDITKNSKRVSKMIVNTGYIPSSKTKEGANDIALVFLEESAPENYPIYKIADPMEVKESKLYFYGYGVTGSNDGGSGILRKTSFSNENFHIDKDNNKIRVKQNNGTGICYGDSGGPALVNLNGEAQILGVNSFVQGPDDDSCSGTATLTLAHSYKVWIQKSLNENK